MKISTAGLTWALLLCGASPAFAAPPPPPATSVGVVVAAEKSVYQEQSYVGRIQATSVVNLIPRVTGFLEQRLFHQGDDVTKGELLYVIEQGPYAAALAQQQAALAQAKAQMVNARVALSRAQRLLHTPAGQQSLVDDAQATYDSDSAQVAAAQAQVANAQINFAYTEIRAPISGRIGATAINVGNVVSPTTGTLATIVTQDPMNVLFSLPVRDALKLREEYAAKGGLDAVELHITLPDGTNYDQTGKLDFVSNQISQATDSLNVQGSIANPVIPGLHDPKAGDRALTDGEFINVVLRSKTPERRIVLPREAVLSDQFGDYVLAVDAQNKVVRQTVTLGATTPETATIARGISPGDKIIVDGIQKVHPGLVVNPSPADTSTPDQG